MSPAAPERRPTARTAPRARQSRTPAAPSFGCSLCRASFGSVEEFDAHIKTDHHTRRTR